MEKLIVVIALTLLSFGSHAHSFTLKKGIEIGGYWDSVFALFNIGELSDVHCELEFDTAQLPDSVSNGVLEKDINFNFGDLRWENYSTDLFGPREYYAILRFSVKSSEIDGKVICVDRDYKPVRLLDEELVWKILLGTPIGSKVQIFR
jgi:hypothetical protein